MRSDVSSPMDLCERDRSAPSSGSARTGIVVVLLLVAVALLAGRFALRKEAERRDTAASSPDVARIASEHPQAEASAPEGQSERVAAQTPPPPSAGESQSSPEPAAAAPAQLAHVLVNGTAVRVDETGTEHARDDGLLRLSWLNQGEVERREVAVRNGAFALELRPDVVLRVVALVLADVSVTLDKDEYVIPADHALLLRGTGMRAVLLHAVSLEAGSELTGVDVLRSNSPFAETKHPGRVPEGEFVARAADSPLRLVPGRIDHGSKALYFVRATGRAWAPIEIDHAGAGERTLQLARAGALEVQLVGNAAWLKPEIRLWPPQASATEAYAYALAAPDADDRALFEDLAAGTYRVTVERGWADKRTSFGSALVDVPAGERASTAIQLALPEAPVPVSVAGQLRLPQAWGEAGIQLVFQAQGKAAVWNDGEHVLPLAKLERGAASDGATRFAWSLELPIAGDYELVVAPLTLRRLLHVPAAGLSGIELDVPAPADVEVKVVDLANGEELFVESLLWSPPRVEGIAMTPMLKAAADAKSRRVTFRVPAGKIGIQPGGYQLCPQDENALFEVHAGSNLVEYPVQRQVEVHFRFLDGEATVPWSWGWRIGAQRVDGAAQDVARGIGMLWFREEGSYKLTARGSLAPFEGFEDTVFTVRFPTPGEKPSVVDVRLRRP